MEYLGEVSFLSSQAEKICVCSNFFIVTCYISCHIFSREKKFYPLFKVKASPVDLQKRTSRGNKAVKFNDSYRFMGCHISIIKLIRKSFLGKPSAFIYEFFNGFLGESVRTNFFFIFLLLLLSPFHI